MSILSTLIEQHDAATAARDAFRAEALGIGEDGKETRDFNEAGEIRFAELDEVCVKLEERIAEVNEAELRLNKVNEARKRVSAPAVVTSEARTYGPEHPENSYFGDMAKLAMGAGVEGYADAAERQAAHGREMVRDAVNDSKFRSSVVRKAKEHYRRDGLKAREIVRDLESRAMDTTAGSAFVTPQYLVDDWAAYRQYNRPFADAANKNALPDYGMTINIPQVTGPSAVPAQASQNTSVSETDPTAGYLTSSLSTLAGQVTISQQLMDRAGPGIQFDRIVFDSLNRNYAQTFDAALITSVLAQSPGSVTLPAAPSLVSAGVGGSTSSAITGFSGYGPQYLQILLNGLGQAAVNMEITQGTVLSPTHAFVTGAQAGFMGSWLDGFGRPYLANSPSNSPFSGADNSDSGPAESATGWNVGGLPFIKDSNIPAASGNAQILVAHMPEVWYWEGDLVPRTIPQTYAQNLSILLQVYTYWSCIVRYPKAVQVLSGPSFPSTPTWILPANVQG